MPDDATSDDDGGRHLRVDALAGDLRGRSIRGGIVTFGAQGVKVAAQFGAVIVLARLLPPDAFGLIAMVAALAMVLDLVKELGLSAATIQRPDITHDQVTALFWINTLMGAVIAAALILAAPAIAGFYGQPALVGITRWLALGFLVSGATTQHWALLRRQMRFTAIAGLETSAECLGFAIAIVLALHGAGYWTLVAQRLTGPVLLLVGCWTLCGWRPGWPRRAPNLRGLLTFGGAVTLCNLATALARSLDQILVGWLWGPAVLGLYERSTKLLQTPTNNISIPLYAVAMPALSRIDACDPRYRQAFGEIVTTLAMLTIPAGALVAVAADWVVAVLFGPAWHDAAPLVAFFGIAMAYQPVLAALGLVYLTQERSAALLRATLLDAGLLILLVLAGLPFGVLGVAAVTALGGLVLRAPLALWLASRGDSVRFSDLCRAIAPSAVAAVSAAVAVSLLRELAVLQGASPAKALALATLVAVAATLVPLAAIRQSREVLLTLARMPRHFTGARRAAI